MSDKDHISLQEPATEWYRCKNLACSRWISIRIGWAGGVPGESGFDQDGLEKHFQYVQINLYNVFCPMCGHKHSR